MIFDLTAVQTLLLQSLGAVLLALGIALCRLVLQRVNIQISDAKKDELEDMAQKSLTAGIVAAQGLIKAKGWDHVDVKSAIVSSAINYALDKFPDTLRRSDINPATPVVAGDKIAGLMLRKFPDAVTVAAVSPATPPVRATPAPGAA